MKNSLFTARLRTDAKGLTKCPSGFLRDSLHKYQPPPTRNQFTMLQNYNCASMKKSEFRVDTFLEFCRQPPFAGGVSSSLLTLLPLRMATDCPVGVPLRGARRRSVSGDSS